MSEHLKILRVLEPGNTLSIIDMPQRSVGTVAKRKTTAAGKVALHGLVPASSFLIWMRDYLLNKTEPYSTNAPGPTDVVDRDGSFLLLGQADRVELPDVMRTCEASSPVLNNQMPTKRRSEAGKARDRRTSYIYMRKKRMEEMLIAVRLKHKALIREADELGLSHLLTRGEYFSIHPVPERFGQSGEDKC